MAKDEAAPKEEEKKQASAEKEKPETWAEVDEEINESQDEKLPFPTAAVVRIMKKHLDQEKMIKKEVKIAMNEWLAKICEIATKRMNKIPYTMVSLNEFKEGIKIFETLAEFESEKKRILAHFEAMKQDIYKLERDLGKTEDDVLEMG